MRRAVTVGVIATVMLAGTSPAAGTWSDSATVTGKSVTAGMLEAPVLDCDQGFLGSSVTITWPVQTQPTTPTYVATVQSVTLPPPVISNGQASVTITGDLLSSLIAGTKTVSVVGGLPGTSWSSAAGTDTITFAVLGLLVYC